MGAFPIIVLTGCLNAFRWLLWTVSVLLSVLLIVQKLRNDADLRPGPELIAIAAFLLAGMATGWISRRVSASFAKVQAAQRAISAAAASPDIMGEVRREINRLDDALVALLALRQRQIEKAAAIKPGLGIPARVPARVDEVLARVGDAAAREGLDQSLAHKIWSDLIEWSIGLEERLIAASMLRSEQHPPSSNT